MRSSAKIERWEEEYVYTHWLVAYHLFRSSHRHQLPQVVFRAKVAPIAGTVHRCLDASRVSVDLLRCHCDKESSPTFDFYEPLPGVFRSLPSPCYAREPQHPTSSLLGLWRKVS